MLLTKRQFLTSVLALSVSAAARAAGGPSGPAVHFQSQGKIGENGSEELAFGEEHIVVLQLVLEKYRKALRQKS
jgi:hypothetical protein